MILRSLTFKFFGFLLLLGGCAVGSAVYIFERTQSFPPSVIYIGIPSLFLMILLYFIFLVSSPVFRLTSEVKHLLTGKKYQRLNPHSADEIGVLTHFFNKITLSVENISKDIIENKKLMSEIDIARRIQQDILPSKAPDILGLDVVARTRPAAQVGGDSFDFLKQNNNMIIYIGDVTGHGVPAGLVMMVVNTLIHAFARHGMFPHEILTKINTILHQRLKSQQFMTLVMLRWDEVKQQMHYIGAGHEYILIYRAQKRIVEKIPTGGIALRMAPDLESFIEEKNISLEENDVILLYSDGITEGKNPKGEMYSVDTLQESFRKYCVKGGTAERIFDGVTKDFSTFMEEYEKQEDDITMIVVRKLPSGEKVRTPVQLNIGGLVDTHTGESGLEKRRWEWER